MKIFCKLGWHKYYDYTIERITRETFVKGKVREYYIFILISECRCGHGFIDTRTLEAASRQMARTMHTLDYGDDVENEAT